MKTSQKELEKWAEDQELGAIQILVLAMDEALEDRLKIYGERFNDSDSERGAFRCIVYMLRCASAHNPISPVWQCNGHYQKQFSLPSLGIVLDGNTLNGTPVQASHYGGWTRLKLLVDRCLELVK